MQDRINSSEEARNHLKTVQLEEATTQIIGLEEELYQAKKVQIEMLD